MIRGGVALALPRRPLGTRIHQLAGSPARLPLATHRLASLPAVQALPRPAHITAAGGGLGSGVHRDLLFGLGHALAGALAGPLASGLGAMAGVGLAAIDSWALGGARAALLQAASVIGATTAPRLDSAWFSSEYFRVAGLAALLTLPFLFAAATQAILTSDLSLLARAAFLYLPLAMLAVALAAPVTMLLLAATDQMCATVSAAGSGGGAQFLVDAAAIGAVDPLNGTAFLAFAVGALTVAGALALAIEMLVREAAVYVVVLMLPLAFAAFVWPARRIWAVRTVELLVALILSKFAIVAVLSLAGAAFGAAGGAGPARLLMAMALVVLAAFAPWGIVRLLPFTAIATGAAAELRSAPGNAAAKAAAATGAAGGLARAIPAADWAQAAPAAMADDAVAAWIREDRDPPGGSTDPPVDGPQGHPAPAAHSKPTSGSAEVSTGPAPRSAHVSGDAAPGSAGVKANPPPGSAPGNAAARSADTRVDDIDPALRAQDMTWKPVQLGLDDGWPPRLGAHQDDGPATGGIADPPGDPGDAGSGEG